MNTTIWNRILLASMVMFFGGCSISERTVAAANSTPPQLFTLEPTPERNVLQKTASGYLATLLGDPANAEVTLVKIDPARVSQQTQDLAVSLPDGKTAQFHLRDFTTLKSGIDSWVGYKPSAWKATHAASASEIEYDPFYYLSLVREGDKLVGNLIVEGQRYRLDSIGSGRYVLIKVDESKLPPDGDPLVAPAGVARDDTKVKLPQSAHSVIRLMFLATNQRKAANPWWWLDLLLAMSDANQYMKNSDVQITYQWAGNFFGDYDETGRSSSQQLGDIGKAQPFASQVLSMREELRADMVLMYTTEPSVCGRAYISTGKDSAHSIVTCPRSLAHELGHNIGALHKQGETGNVPEYAYGYETPLFNLHTQMVASRDALPNFSNPRVTYLGMPLGDSKFNDVARRFNERRETVENFYPPPNPLTVLVQLFSDYNQRGDMCTLKIEPGVDQPPCNKVKSIRVYDFAPGMKLCFRSEEYKRVCYAGSYAGDFGVPNLKAVSVLPSGLVREGKVGDDAFYGDVKYVEYAMDNQVTIKLYSLADFKGETCEFRMPTSTVGSLSEWPQCAALSGGKSRSAKVFSFSSPYNKLCFFNADHRQSLCFNGNYQGNFSIRNWDVGTDLPSGLVRTHRGGGYMNGSVHRISYGNDSEDWPPAP